MPGIAFICQEVLDLNMAGTYMSTPPRARTCDQTAEALTSEPWRAGAQFEGNLGEILALGAEISPYIGLREKWESP